MILLHVFGLLVVVSFLAYVSSILVPFLRHRPAPMGDPAQYGWHVFVPCRDEEAVIAATLTTLRATSPDTEVWVIDDASEDATADIVGHMAETDMGLHLVRRRLPDARTGKGEALNAAYRALDAWLPPDADRSSIVVCVLDADGVMGPDAWAYASGTRGFDDPAVGAVQIEVRMRNVGDPGPHDARRRLANGLARLLVRMQDLEFRTVIAAMQMLRSHCESVGLGGNGQFTRLSMLDKIAETEGQPWHGALLEDYELGVHALLAGWRVSYIHEAHVDQEGLTSVSRLIRQRTRWAQGNMQCSRYLFRILSSPSFTLGGALEASYFLILPFVQVTGLVVWPILIGVLVHQALSTPGGIDAWMGQDWGLLVLTFMFGVAPFLVWGPVYRRRCQPDASWLTGVAWGFANWIYVFYMYLANARAFYQLARGETGWAKTRRNAETGSAAAAKPGWPAAPARPVVPSLVAHGPGAGDRSGGRVGPPAIGVVLAQGLLLCRSRAAALGVAPAPTLAGAPGRAPGGPCDDVAAVIALAGRSPRSLLELSTRTHRVTPARLPGGSTRRLGAPTREPALPMSGA